MTEMLETLRDQIKNIDRQIVELIARRQSLSVMIGEHKKKEKSKILDIKQESLVTSRWRDLAYEYDIDTNIALSISYQIRKMSRKAQAYIDYAELESQTSQFQSKIKKLERDNIKIFNLGVGEDDLACKRPIITKTINYLSTGKIKYTDICGNLSLRRMIADKFCNEGVLQTSFENVMVSHGAKQCVYMALRAILNPTDEVIVPTPCWPSYIDIVKRLEGLPICVATDIENDFKITSESLRSSINENTRALILNNPGNPTGNVYTKNSLVEIAEVLKDYPRIWIIADEIYCTIMNNGARFCRFASIPMMTKQTITIDGFSKSDSMTGFRIGYMVAPDIIINNVKAQQSQINSSACTVSQIAAEAAIRCNSEALNFEKQREIVQTALYKVKDVVKHSRMDGGFYAFLVLNDSIDSRHANAIAEKLLIDHSVAVIAGSAFYFDRGLRICYARDIEIVRKGMERIVQYMLTLSSGQW